MPLSSSCQNCGAAKPVERYADPFCNTCSSVDTEAQQHFASEHPDALQSDILYAGRMARQARAMRPGSNYVDPRTFSASRRGLPSKPGA